MLLYCSQRSIVLRFTHVFFSIFCFSSKRDNELLLRLIANLNMLLKDDSVNVVKKAILTLTQMYKITLQVSFRPPPKKLSGYTMHA